MENKTRAEGTVRGALALTLRISQFAGVAPLRFVRERDGWRISVLPSMCIYSYMILFTLCAGTLSGVFTVGPKLSADTNPFAARRLVGIFNMLLTASAASLGICTSATRMKRVIKYLNQIYNLNLKIFESQPWKVIERRKSFVTVGFTSGISLMYLLNIYIFVHNSVGTYTQLMVLYQYSCFYLGKVILILAELQFMLIALIFDSALNSVNSDLKDLISLKDFQAIGLPRSSCGSTRRFIQCHGIICDLVQQVNKCDGAILLFILGTSFGDIITLSYYVILYFMDIMYKTNTSVTIPVRFVMSSVYCISHVLRLVVLVEVGHRIHKRMEHTSVLISQLSQLVTSSDDPLAFELDLLYKKIILNRLSYSPMGICTLSRPLIATMFGSVTTYLVILLQFHASERSNAKN